MGKYRHTYTQAEYQSTKGQIHPAWKAIGCLLMMVFPVLAYAGAVLIVRENFKQKWFAVPGELVGSIVLPNIGRIYYLDIALTVLLMIIGFSLLMIFYSVMGRILAPSSFRTIDVPPPGTRVR